MKNKKLKQIFVIVLGSAIIMTSLQLIQNINAEDSLNISNMTDDSFYVLDENGKSILIDPSENELKELEKIEENTTYKVVSTMSNDKKIIDEYDSLEDAENQFAQKKRATYFRSRSNAVNDVQLFINDDIMTTSNSSYNIVKFKRTLEKNEKGAYYVANINYTELNTGRKGYLNPSSIADAAYIRIEGNYYICKMGGVVIKVHKDDVAGTPTYAEAENNNNLSYYKVANGKLVHYYSIYNSATSTKIYSTTVGYKPSYLSTNKEYYSYDGHYFYTSFEAMIDDYRVDNYKHAVNANEPYYNYYQYLSLRTKTRMTAAQFNNRVKDVSKNPEISKMKDKGQAFIDAQNTYGVNAGVIFGVAANESAYGNSSIALNKNNIFGLNAVDSNAGQSANSFNTVEDSINDFAYGWMSKGYLSPIDGRYRGSHLGDKNSGINVKYASDPYWGEKAASQGYSIDTPALDYGRYTIGIAKKTKLSVYNQPTKSSKELYNSEAVGSGTQAYMYDYPVVILDTVKGTDGNTWYKIQTDAPLLADRTKYDITAKYDYARDYAYVLASDVNIVFKGNGDIDAVNIVRGDVNGNGKVDAADYLMVMDTILGKYNMQSHQKIAGDVNGNGKIDAADYLMIMDCILGKIKL